MPNLTNRQEPEPFFCPLGPEPLEKKYQEPEPKPEPLGKKKSGAGAALKKSQELSR